MNNQTFALKVKIPYSDKNIQKLKERFLRFEGVDKVDVEAEHELVIITGTVDPLQVIYYLESKNIPAQVYTNHDGSSDSESVSSKNPKPKKPKKQSSKEKKDVHVCEPYEPLKIDPLICRDIYCKNHKSRATINSKVPPISSGDHLRHNNMQRHGFSFGNELPMHGLHGFGQIPMMQQPPFSSFGFPGFDNFRRGPYM